MTANYATAGYVVQTANGPVSIQPGETRDSITDATIIATWSGNWTATAPTALTVGFLLAGYYAQYPRGN